MNTLRRLKKTLIVGITAAGLLTLIVAGLYGWIQWDAYTKADSLWHTHYPQAAGRMEAAILRMQDERCSFRERNRAVWVLGRLADERALAALENEYTGAPCDHEHALCQYELRKAIQRCGGPGKPGDYKVTREVRSANTKGL